MHFFYNENNDVLIGTTFTTNKEEFTKLTPQIFVSETQTNIFNPKSFNIDVQAGYNKFDVEQINIIKKLTNLDFTYDYTSGIKLGYVLECEVHPDSDHMHVLKVNVGNDEILDIVCGASNIAKGLYVAVATPNAYLPNLNLFIKPSKLRGIPSNGMICSKAELGLSQEKGKGIWEITESKTLGMDVFQIK